MLVVSPFLPSTGLIIDAFGELRDQLEQVKEDLEVSYSFQYSSLFYTHLSLLILYLISVFPSQNMLM